MTQTILILVALLVLALIVGLFVVSVRCAFRFPKASLIFSVILVSGCVLYYKHFEKQLRLSYVPIGLRVENILYASEESWGFGPGGNETGVIVYKLPDSVARQIDKVGVAYFSTMPPQTGDSHDWHGRYDKWQHTPVSANTDWVAKNDNGIATTPIPEIASYLNKYGFGISMDPKIKAEIDYAISEPGSYFAYGRIGVLIVVPKTRRVVYAYNG